MCFQIVGLVWGLISVRLVLQVWNCLALLQGLAYAGFVYGGFWQLWSFELVWQFLLLRLMLQFCISLWCIGLPLLYCTVFSFCFILSLCLKPKPAFFALFFSLQYSKNIKICLHCTLFWKGHFLGNDEKKICCLHIMLSLHFCLFSSRFCAFDIFPNLLLW